MRPKDIVRSFCKPENQMGSVIETLEVFIDILESRDAYMATGNQTTAVAVDESLAKALFTLGFLPFYKVHGAVLRPLYLQAINQTGMSSADYFISQAIPTSLTIALPNTQMKYGEINKAVLDKLRE